MMKKIYANGTDEKAFLEQLAKRTGETDKRVSQIVTEIIETVRAGGDQAVQKYTKQFDGELPQYYEVPQEVIEDALNEADEDFVNALLDALSLIHI